MGDKSLPAYIQVIIAVGLIVSSVGASAAVMRYQGNDSKDKISVLDEDITTLRDEVVKQMALIETEQDRKWEKNEEEHDDIKTFQYETRNLISAFQSTADSIKSDITELKYSMRESSRETEKKLELNYKEMKMWERERLLIEKTNKENNNGR